MGTRCPLHLISSLSHGVLSPGRKSRAGMGGKVKRLWTWTYNSRCTSMLCPETQHKRSSHSMWHGILGEPLLRLIKSPCAFEHVKLKMPTKSNSKVDKYWQLRLGNGAITRGESYPSAGHPKHSHRCWLLTWLAVSVVLFQFGLWIPQDRGCCFCSCTLSDGRFPLILRKSLDIWC